MKQKISDNVPEDRPKPLGGDSYSGNLLPIERGLKFACQVYLKRLLVLLAVAGVGFLVLAIMVVVSNL